MLANERGGFAFSDGEDVAESHDGFRDALEFWACGFENDRVEYVNGMAVWTEEKFGHRADDGLPFGDDGFQGCVFRFESLKRLRVSSMDSLALL